MNNKNPLLSILIPTYNYKIGLMRIMYFLQNLPKDKCEIVIYDNSPNEETKEYVDNWIVQNQNINIRYRLNRPITAPAKNWNDLIEDSKGKYCLLLHNGEFPDSKTFFEKLVENLEKTEPDTALVRCILTDLEKKDAFFNLPLWLKGFVIKYFPKYLFKQNVIGPTSTLIIKKELYAKFDDNLKWLLDVDSYYRSLIVSKNIQLFKNINMISVLNKSDTLTKELGTKISKIEKNEKKYLTGKYNDILWIKNEKNIFENIVVFTENIIWKIFVKIYTVLRINLKKRLEVLLENVWRIK